MLHLVHDLLAATTLREARLKAGLSQAELAAKVGVTQSVISVYEAGRRQPSVATLARLIAGAGFELELDLGSAGHHRASLSGPIGLRVARYRRRILDICKRHGVDVLGVFGSVARGDERPDSDVDLLVALPDGIGLLGVGRLSEELEALLHTRVDLVPEAGLKRDVRRNVMDDLVPL